VASVLVLGAPITAVFQSLASGTAPGPAVLVGEVLILVAVAVIALLAVRPGRREAMVAS
jgi:hypothetical protein